MVNDRNDPGGNVEYKLEMACCREKTKRLKSDEKGDDRCAGPGWRAHNNGFRSFPKTMSGANREKKSQSYI